MSLMISVPGTLSTMKFTAYLIIVTDWTWWWVVDGVAVGGFSDGRRLTVTAAAEEEETDRG